MGDRWRSYVLGGACAAFVVIPTVGPLLGKGEQTRRYDTVITPPDYAFVVWAPIFAGSALATGNQLLPGNRARPVSRRTGWPLAGAFATNALWSLAAQGDRFALTPFLLPVATAFAAVAHARQQRLPAPAGWAAATPASTGLLLGWTALASAVNVAAGAKLAGARESVAASVAGVLGVAGAVTAGVAASRRGRLPLALASGWGLLTTALYPRRPRGVRIAAAAGAAAIAAAARR
ncbi:hypothetical protein [Paractinoplanes rishiriensis]|uniref:Tryptophan-rich sensory protein n=1 Tax=Paractinoplanes rishiriensis TaxID=1050105 RepID=A0A919JYD8_9ACTN|nr:hypothetical protein [Actinoplanes rishiriensis]GIE97170.1 hypothetical protein Ari01nite_46350 [Actinoplanes rishiriensis]